MPKENVFHEREVLVAKLNDMDAKIPIIVAATGEELSLPESHFRMTEDEKQLSRLQLFIKKAKMFAYDGKQPTRKITGLSNTSIVLFGKPQQLAPNSIMQNEELLSTIEERARKYLDIVLSAQIENDAETYLNVMIDRIYTIIKKACPRAGEVIHLVTMERDLSKPDASKNRLTAEFSELIMAGLRRKISKNNEPWRVELDRVLALKQRTSRAESYGIHRIAQQPLMLYQPRNADEEIEAHEKVIIVDDHIQAGAAIASSASEIIQSNANLLGVVCISAHKNSQVFNIQQDVKDFIISLLPNRSQDVPVLNDILKIVGLNLEVLTNVEGMILGAMLSEPENGEHKSAFERLLKKYDASADINHPLFKQQVNSLKAEFDKPKVEFSKFKNELILAVEKGRYTVPYDRQIVLSDKDGQDIRSEVDSRSNLPWLLFDFDNTLHHLGNNTFIIFQDIIRNYTGVTVSIEEIIKTRQELKETGQYKYQEMLISFIKNINPNIRVGFNEITEAYLDHKNEEPFMPKISKENFLALRRKYRIGIITDGTALESKVPKIKAAYGVDIDGYVNNDRILGVKPSPAMLHEFCKIYDVKTKPVAYVGDSEELDGGMAKNANLNFISVDPAQSMIDMEEFTAKLNVIEERRIASRMRWSLIRNAVESHQSAGVTLAR